ncbi:hypothetical protein B0T10DRAFT_480330 [Thelonectria olida]|uniref:NDT80 domain-containing protein n=1 Tax=Thelonectria olida TaxID=1576542 RepID=A0A9P8WCS4_9HYPO|nr:hypothetical protein B0T10DRAFT_480330 [Thelonectria olida]
MANFNAMPGPSGASPNDLMIMDFGTGQSQVFDPELAFDDSLFENAVSNMPLQSFTPGPGYEMDALPNIYVDPFSTSSRQFDPPPRQDALHEESPPQELDNKLLGFSPTVSSASVLNGSGQLIETPMTGELYGMFFVAEDVFGGETTGRPLELTCYRRNLWQCAGTITLPRIVSHILDDQGAQIPIFELVATITATESNEGKVAEIISIPWKTPAQAADENKSIGPPPIITLDLTSGHEIDANRVSLPVAWKRLQFKHATANNGRRKGLQQHFVVRIGLHGKSQNGDLVKIAEIQSGPVIVRGRSPRNFDGRNNVQLPLPAPSRLERRNTTSTETSNHRFERESSQVFAQNYSSATNIQQNDWQTTPSPQPSAKRAALSPIMPKPPPVPQWTGQSNSSKQAKHAPRHSTSLPINLSLSEDERSPNRSSSDLQSPQPGKGVPMVGQHSENSPSEDADPLYEYFPLTVDDWVPPVDAVYRPHVVHHTIVPSETKDQQLRSKAKRYFAAD